MSFEGPTFSHVGRVASFRPTSPIFCHDVKPSEGTTFGCCVENFRNFSKRPTFFITTRHFYIDITRKSAICRDMSRIFATFFILILYIFANFPALALTHITALSLRRVCYYSTYLYSKVQYLQCQNRTQRFESSFCLGAIYAILRKISYLEFSTHDKKVKKGQS